MRGYNGYYNDYHSGKITLKEFQSVMQQLYPWLYDEDWAIKPQQSVTCWLGRRSPKLTPEELEYRDMKYQRSSSACSKSNMERNERRKRKCAF